MRTRLKVIRTGDYTDTTDNYTDSINDYTGSTDEYTDATTDYTEFELTSTGHYTESEATTTTQRCHTSRTQQPIMTTYLSVLMKVVSNLLFYYKSHNINTQIRLY